MQNGWNKETIGHHLVRNNHISYCELVGIVGSLGAAFSTVTGSTIHDIHVRCLFSGAEMAGIKFHGAIDVTISRNHIFRTCRGMWLDWMTQGTRISGNLCHDNAAHDLFVEVNHGPFMVDNNLFLSPKAIEDDSQGGAYAHNLIAGVIDLNPTFFDGRKTPFHKAHSTEIVALHDNPSGDSHYDNNLFMRSGSLAKYDQAHLPMWMDGNVFFQGTQSSKHESAPINRSASDPGLTLVEKNDGFHLTMTLATALGSGRPSQPVSSARLGKASISDCAFENPDGSPITIGTDYFGKPRNAANPTPGPFEAPGTGTLTMKVWPLPQVKVMAQEVPEHGSLSRVPANRWEDAFVTGNGRLGALIFGNPTNETIVANHCRLFLPLGNREIVPDLAAHVPELRRMIREKGYGEAMKFLLGKAKEQGYPGLIPTDPSHPGLFINIRQPAVGPITDYVRTENFQTGEVTVRWRDNRGQFRRRLFVSRTDNLIVVSLTGPASSELLFPPVSPEAHAAESGTWTAAVGSNLIRSEQQTAADWVTYHNVYVKGKGGYDAAVRIINRDESRDRLLLIRIAPWKTPLPKEQSEAWAYSPDNPDFKTPGIFKPVPALAESSVVAYRATGDAAALLPQLKESLAGLRAGYEALFAPHALAHAALFNRVTLDLGGGTDCAKTTEELLDLAKTEKRLPPALMEKMYDAGRYMLICSAGELLPNLQGIWTGSSKPAWSGDFTLDTNVQAAMASACSANLPELMEGYFRLMESFYPEWRLNAKRIYGCRGVFTNARASNTALELHWGAWPGVFWTAGCGWLASLFTDYADCTGDHEFLEKQCLPLLREIAAFYQDFLTETDKDGHVVFIPSYNPETGCGINATMDIAVAREVLAKLIAADDDDSAKWQALLAKLAHYPINANGELAEWPDGRLEPQHRHHSQLYPCFQSFDPTFETNAVLRNAARASVLAKIAGSGGGGEQSSFGRVYCGVAAAYLGMAEEAYGRLEVMAVKRSMNPCLITSHEPNAEIFNTDGNGGIPQIANTMLLFSRPGQIDLLPALPKSWPNGKVTGLRARGNFTVDIEWKDGKVINYRLTSPEPRKVKVRVNGEVKTVTAEKR